MMDASVSRRPPGHTQQAAHNVFQQLRDKILAVTLAPGTALSRSTLQKQFRLSSTPIRDALMRLEEAGLVDVFPQSGTIVSLIDVPLARQAQFLRLSIELEALRKLAASPDAEIVRQLKSAITEQRNSAKDDDLERFNEADLTFHKILYVAAGVADLWMLVRRRSVHIDRIRRLHLPVSGKAGQIIRDHSAIVKAIAEGDSERAQSELRGHLSQSLAFSDELRVRFPGYFKE
jgi:GntR family transcriptional regulator, rspAB operon transcriptional repressor